MKTRIVTAAMTLACAALSTSANATISTPFGSIRAGGFSLNHPGAWNFGVGASTPSQTQPADPSFGIVNPFFGFGLNPWGIGMGIGHQQALSVQTPFGGVSGPGFGFGANPFFGIGTAGPGAGGYYTGFGGISSPWVNVNIPGFGVQTPWGGVSTPFFGLNGQPQAAPQPQFIPVAVPYPVPMR